jgi:G:T-mismatch repair DNA endonuclease (very short patch repair protein)
MQKNIRVSIDLNSNDLANVNKMVDGFFNNLAIKLTEKMLNNDQILVYINHPSLDIPISIPFIEKLQFTGPLISQNFSKVCQSKKGLNIDHDLEIKAYVANLPFGAGIEMDKEIESKYKSIITIKNNDKKCGIRAFIIGKLIADGCKRIGNITQACKNKKLEEMVEEVCTKLNIHNQPCGLPELARIESYFKEYQLVVFDVLCPRVHKYIYCGPSKTKYIYLFLYENHFYTIRSPAVFFAKEYFCDLCKLAFKRKIHKCPYLCSMCKREECLFEMMINCSKCLKNCKNKLCYELHLNGRCSHTKFCERCQKWCFPLRHVCEEESKWCFNCKESVGYDHRCYIKVDEPRLHKYEGIIYFDYECSQEFGDHVPNLAIAHKYNLNNELVEKKQFYNDGHDCNEEFCSWLFEQTNYVAIAHNFRAYDSMFIMNFILKNLTPGCKAPEIINQGQKILGLEWKNVKFVDSYSFLSMPLSEFSNCFSLPVTKSDFPHLFNKASNQSYDGDIPDAKYWNPDFYSVKKRKEFFKWHEDQRKANYKFNFKNEFFSYAEKDVELLARGCIAFRNIIFDIAKIEPFFSCYTIASLCHKIYRMHHMIPNSIAVIPENGYNPNEKTSVKCQLWLSYLSVTRNIYIQHARNGFEHKEGVYKLDGVLKNSNGVVIKAFEFHGCYFHCCLKCVTPQSWNPIMQEKMQFTRDRHNKRMKFLKSRIRYIEEIWECEWDNLVKTNADLRDYIQKHSIKPRLELRNAMMGGNTNVYRAYVEVKEGEKICAFDVCSMYPFIQRWYPMPYQHPIIYRENFTSIDKYFGIIYCEVLAPPVLLHPVLPLSINNKLIFTLCFTCALENNTDYCEHNDKERALVGTWCTPELVEAQRLDYKILNIYEVYHWEQKSDKLFTEYVNTFIKMKQEASGFPEWVKSDQDKEKYKIKCYEDVNVNLDLNKICKNPGLRKTAKICLNSHWGRFAMNANKTKMQIMTDASDWYNLFMDKNNTIHYLNISNPEIIQVGVSENKKTHTGSPQSNLAIAAFTTCYARLKLHNALMKVGDRAIYSDTDSVYFLVDDEFLHSPNMIKTGDNLGDWTDECADGNYIKNFICYALKTYAVVHADGSIKIKAKGLECNYKAQQVLNVESFKKLLDKALDRIRIEQSLLKRTKYTFGVKTTFIEKEQRLVIDKRVLIDGYKTRPFGTKFI